MATYKTKDGVDRTIPGVGRTVNGLITTSFTIENSMFEVVPDDAPTAPVAAAPVSPPQPPAAQPPTDTKETK